MTHKELRRLRREELLELLIAQGKKNEELEAQVASLQQELQSRHIAIQEAGSLAQAALILNDVFSAADAAAKQYLENIRRMEEKLRRECAGNKKELSGSKKELSDSKKEPSDGKKEPSDSKKDLAGKHDKQTLEVADAEEKAPGAT